MPERLIQHSVRDLAAALRDGRISAGAIAESVIAAFDRFEPVLGAYRSFDPDLLRRQAAAADALFKANVDLGPFQGLPVSVKDLYGLAGFHTWAGTPKRLPDIHDREGPVVGSFRRQSALLAGKTHTVEFAFGGLGTNRHYGAPRNPWDAQSHRVSGGSSSGAGVSLWQGTAVLALGSDTTGSVRMPASWTGTVGLKVSRGRWSCDGLLAQSETLDTPGLLARSVEDAALAFAAIDGVREEPFAWLDALGPRDLAQLRVGVVRRPFFESCSPGVVDAVERALSEIEQAGATLVDLDLPEATPAYELWRNGHLSAPEAYATLTSSFPAWLDTIDPNIWARMRQFGEMPAAEYINRRRRVLGWMESVDRRLADVDAFITPTIPITAPRLADVENFDGYRHHNTTASRNAAILSLLDVCALTVPVGLDAVGIPVGLQVAARRGTEPRLLAIGLAIERCLGTAPQRLGLPPMVAVDPWHPPLPVGLRKRRSVAHTSPMTAALRTPDERFESLPGYPFAPHYAELPGFAGLRMHHLDEGPALAADVFLCLHGEPTWSYLYRRMIPVFAAAGARVVAPDLFGFGRSDKPVDDSWYSFETHRATLLALIDTLDLNNITLVCQDWGGLLGLTLPMDRPGRFTRALVMNTTIGTGDQPLSEGFLAWRAWAAAHPDMDVGKLMARTCRHLSGAEVAAYDAPFPDARHKAGVRRFPQLVPDHAGAPGAALSRRARDWWSQQWRGQTFMAIGMSDPVLGPAVMQSLRSVIHGCPPAMEVGNAGHFTPEWGETIAVRALAAFAADHAAGA